MLNEYACPNTTAAQLPPGFRTCGDRACRPCRAENQRVLATLTGPVWHEEDRYYDNDPGYPSDDEIDAATTDWGRSPR